jgi:hypothetical protein
MRRFDLMGWKTWTLALAGFVAVCLLADLFFTRIIILRNPSSNTVRILHLYQENGDEIPIFGTSKARWNYIPSELGLNVFNYGIDGGSFEIADMQLGIELAKPKTTPVIIELQYTDTRGLGDVGQYLPLDYDPRIRQLLARFHELTWRSYVPGIRYFGYYDWYLKDYLTARFQSGTRVDHGYPYSVPPVPFDRARLQSFEQIRLHSTNGYFPDEDQNRRLIAHITTHPQRLFFLVFSPYHSSCFVHFENVDKLKAYEERLSALPNVVLLDWSRLDYPDEFFFDTLHLQHDGAVDFSRKLGDQIHQILRERNGHAAGAAAESK